MQLRISISKTKEFFKKALPNFKSLLFGGYHRLPKTPSFNPLYCGGDTKISHSFRELDNFYEDLSNIWDSHDQDKEKKKKKSTEAIEDGDDYTGSFLKFGRQEETIKARSHKREIGESSFDETMRDERSYLMTQKLKDLEVMDLSNVDHVLDIEEVLYYYSRLKSPVYLDIVNKFFMEIYTEAFISE